jgi:hypothetical protein
VSPAESVARATQWLQELITELSGLRNATSRDPSFKNWRQNAITYLQRIWPTDQDHAERFRRIPFSPVDPRADMRAQRESFSRGCQEAARVLTSFIEEIAASGVPEIASNEMPTTEESGFEDGFPTVDFPSGDLSMPPQPDHGYGELPPQHRDPALHFDASANASAPAPSDSRPRKGVAAKLRDLLGLTGFTGKPAPPPAPTRTVGESRAMSAPLPRALDIVPVGDEVDAGPPPTTWTAPKPGSPAPGVAEPAASVPPAPSAPPAEAGMSVVMSRPTTLRSSIEKVSIESLISPEFRGGNEAGNTSQAAAPTPAPPSGAQAPEDDDRATGKSGANKAAGAPRRNPKSATTPAPRGTTVSQAMNRPPLSIVPPLASDPEFNVDPAPSEDTTVAPPQPVKPNSASKIVPLPVPPSRAAEPAGATDDDGEATEANVDPEELARATEDFMRSSPVLGATGRKVQRTVQEPVDAGFTDPDAIAILSMVDELTQMGVPTTRQSETRARLVDLARRIESGQLEWNALRKAVWFAMEYPEVARRLMPLLLPWIDRAA